MNSIRTAISLPWDQYQRIEALRKKLGLSRSSIFQKALNSILKYYQDRESIRQYLAGYCRDPENTAETQAMAQAAADAFQAEDLK
ncbi:MAG: hypothetical protein HY922_15750 [Elusimicrobia bacterium]|nr:hypothetical protein [Elusimicrobiota bacterium]